MGSKDAFVIVCQQVVDNHPEIFEDMDVNEVRLAREYFDSMTSANGKMTDNGKIIMDFLQRHEQIARSAKEIGLNVGLTSRGVSGAMRKLITDGYVNKTGTNPVTYLITPVGMDLKIDN